MPQRETPGENGAMEGEQVYGHTTVPIQGAGYLCSCSYFNKPRCIVKLLEVVFSFLAFVLEEVVASCEICHALYFFEFVSCSAFFLTFLLLIILTTSLKEKVSRVNWQKVDFCYTCVIASFFLIACVVFAAKNGGSHVEKAAVAFGFLATFAFVVDIVLCLKDKEWPMSKKETIQAETPRDPKTVKGETEPLNESGAVPV
ncbi:CKLF-like MARVEL transmembrane domain-containing protein 6 [Rhinoraja longicauda]